MSAKKVTESTKVPVEESSDSGFVSGPLSEQLSSDYLEPEDSDTYDKKQTQTLGLSDTYDKKQLEDQGVCLLTGTLDELDISDSTPIAPIVQPLVAKREEPKVEPLVTPLVTPLATQPVPSVRVDEGLDSIRAILFSQDEEGDTKLHIAAVHGCTKSVGTLIKLCPDKSWLDIQNDYGHTALHLAVMSRHVVVARMLVMAGASLAVRDHTGETPLHTAVSTGQKDCIQALVDPAPGYQRIRSAIFDQKNYNGQACVHLAASAGRVDLLQTLVYYGADINIREGRAGWTPLHIAARSNNEALAQYLLSRCAGVVRAPRDYAGRTPRRLARRTRLAAAFTNAGDSDSESEDDEYDSDSEQLFEKLSAMSNAQSIDVV